MTLNKIKKALYKEKPVATRVKIINTGDEDVHFYRADLKEGRIFFRIPVSEMGENQFAYEEQAQLLIRWIAFNT